MMSKLIFELNEFNVDLLREAADKRKNIKKLINMNSLMSEIPDRYDSDFLEPWSQWVSIHTGTPAIDHNIKHLGDSINLKHSAVWDDHPQDFGVIWGCLNSNNPLSNTIKYFPDPWTKTSETNIKKTKVLQDFLRHSVSDRGERLWTKVTYYSKLFLHGLRTMPILFSNLDLQLLKRMFSLKFIKNFGSSTIYSFVEAIMFNIFLKESKSFDSKTHVFFSNMLAHCQHYYWHTSKKQIMEITLDLIDDMLEKSFNHFSDVVVINGLTQEYSGDKENWNSYYPKAGWQNFIHAILPSSVGVQPCMSYDAILSFPDAIELNKSIKTIQDIRLETGKSIFLVERYDDDDSRLFIRFDYFGDENIDIFFGEQNILS